MSGIILGSQFRLNTALPLDERQQFATVTARDALDALRRWEGMIVYVLENETTYQLVGGITNSDWVVRDGGGAVGLPIGGAAGQVLAKASATDYDVEWVDQSGGGGGGGGVAGGECPRRAIAWDNNDDGTPNTQVLDTNGKLDLVCGLQQGLYLEGLTDGIVLSNSPFSGAPIDGTIIFIKGTDNAKRAVIPYADVSGGFVGNGDAVISAVQNLTVIYNATLLRYTELMRS
jgi:hypothetical protein